MGDKLLPFRRYSKQSTVSDETLVSACGEGNNGALEELFRRHGEQVHRVVARLRYVDSREIDDIVQSTFIEVQRSAKRFGGRASVSTWILGIAMNIIRHHVRGESRRRSAISTIAIVSPQAYDRRPDDQAAQKQAMARLQSGFETLPSDLRIVFTLCDLEGLRGTEVARALAIPEGTVWRRLHEARLVLRAWSNGEVPQR